jgi:hypothetical protein
MSNEDRREFIKKLAKGTAYAAPVVHSLAAPLDLVGQGKSSQHKKNPAALAAPGSGSITQQQQIGAPPPGERPPPGSQH